MYSYLTNQVDLLVLTDSKIGGSDKSTCTDCNTCCKAGSNSANCYFCNQIKYVDLLGHRFIVLERTSEGKIIALLEDYSSTCVATSKIEYKDWGLLTCDGWFYGTYSQTSAVVENIVTKAKDMLKDVPSEYFAFFMLDSESRQVGVITREEFQKYKKGVYGPIASWTVSRYTTSHTSYVTRPFRHGNSTTYNNSYYYVAVGSSVVQKYYGDCVKIRPLVHFNPIYTCTGSGTSEDPFKIL